MKLFHTLFVVLALHAWPRPKLRTTWGASAGWWVPQRTMAGGAGINFGASIAFSANYARQLKRGNTSLIRGVSFRR
jgi:hypothetical protein